MVRVAVPASSANLGPGFDSFAAALGLWLELEVRPGEEFALATDLLVARDRSNLAVAAFERIMPADGWRFEMRSQIPLSGGLGSSAAARVAGLVAARELSGAAGVDVLAIASELEGHADNVAAALIGGIVVSVDGEVVRIDPPAELELVLVVPHRAVATRRARGALPATVPLDDAAYNAAHAALLALGLARRDLELIARGLRDRVHQPYRASLFPRSAALLDDAPSLGALGATISGAGPSVLVWCARGSTAAVTAALTERALGWAEVLPARFAAEGAELR
jgi:homoserine kinase